MGAWYIIELYAIRDVLLVYLSVTFPIITDLGRLNEIVIREITGCIEPQALYYTE